MSTSRSSAQGLLGLPFDIFVIVADRLSGAHAKALALDRRLCCPPARYRLLKNFAIDLRVADFGPTRQWLQMMERDDWLPAVRRLVVLDLEYNHYRREYRECNEDPMTHDRDICRALPAMKGLVSLDWKGNRIPSFVLKCLESCPQVRLTAHPHERRQRQLRALNASDDSLVRRLQHYRVNLCSLDVELRCVRADECSAFMRNVKGILPTCKSLRKLRLNVHMPDA